MTYRSRRTRAGIAGLALLAVATATAVQNLPATAVDGPAAIGLADPDAFVTIGDSNVVPGLEDITAPLTGGDKGLLAQVAPTAAQKAAVPAGVDVQWNDFGTPSSIFTPNGLLMSKKAGETPDQVATRWISANTTLLGITDAQAADLKIISDQPFADSAARAVLFRQKFGELTAATRSMVTVGVNAAGDVSYVSTSLAKAQGAAPSATISPLQGWLKAAAAVGRPGISADAVKVSKTLDPNGGWTRLTVPGFVQTQVARLRAFAKPDGTVRPVIEANVVNSDNGGAMAYRVMIDAVDGTLLFRQNAVENSNDAFPFQGSYPGDGCGPKQPFAITDNSTKTIVMTAAAVVAADDIRIKLFGPLGNQLGDYDLSTSPETGTYSASTLTPITAGTYNISVCSFDANQIGGPYVAQVTTTDTAVGSVSTGSPRWLAFTANPSLASTKVGSVPTGTIECWFKGTTECADQEAHQNVAAFGPWDTQGALSTFTTVGNNANTHEAWASFLTPGGLAQAPVSPTRDYTTAFTDAWNESGCNPANLVPGGNDINAVTTGLFVGHNRIHDFSYYLGFNEKNYNLQTDNSSRGGMGGDAEIGNVQAGAVTGGAAGMYMGRDNANQIALQDGIPGITNQYLFQPIAGAFYSPCTDGALDTGIYGHEYTHAISNRMVGGPDDGLTSDQGGAMGESWSDLNASEYQFENDYLSDPAIAKNPWSLGSYTTGNFDKGIRDYAINSNPLNFSDYGFDTTGAEVHADGEIWNGTQWEVRQALTNKWNAQFSYTDKALQEKCEQATPSTTPLDASACPGNRRWIQMIFDAWLLQPGGTDMLQARNAMMAADQMRYPPAQQNQLDLAQAFARRGMGADASTSIPADGSEEITTPSFRSALGNNSAVTFTSTGKGSIYVGDYEARATPVADTLDGGLPATATFTPGIYKMTYASPTQGFRRFIMTVPDNGVSFSQPIDDAAQNLSASSAGATIIASAGSGESLNADFLLDGTEATNWGGQAGAMNIDDAPAQPAVAVDLAGGVSTITSAKVSALLNPAPATPDPTGLGIPVGVDDDPLSGSRFTALRKFALQACTANCTVAANYTTFFTSPDNAFDATIPRPVAPDQLLKTFTFPAVQAAAVRLVALENQCTGQALYSGEQDNDPTNATDCKTASTRGQIVHAAELQVFGAPIPADPTPGTPGTGVPGSGTAGEGTGALPLPGQSSLGTTPASSVLGVAKTRTRIRLPRVQQVRGKESTKLTFAVVSTRTSGGATAGTVIIKMDGKKVKKTKIVVTLKGGKKLLGKKYKIPTSLSFGKHYFTVIFKPTNKAAFSPSRSRKIVLTVIRSRAGLS